MEYNNNYSYNYGTPSETRATYACKTFFWMFLGLLATFAVSVCVNLTGAVYTLCSGFVPFILAIAEIGVVMYLSGRLYNLSISSARGLFFLYAVLNGLTLSSLLQIYSLGSLMLVFGLTSLYFGVMAAYAWFTKADLSYIRPVLMIGLIVMLVYSVIGMLIGLNSSNRFMCIIGVVLFVGFTAYDTQKIRACYDHYAGDDEMLQKASIICALQLYLDYINLFLYLIRLYGKNRRD